MQRPLPHSWQRATWMTWAVSGDLGPDGTSVSVRGEPQLLFPIIEWGWVGGRVKSLDYSKSLGEGCEEELFTKVEGCACVCRVVSLRQGLAPSSLFLHPAALPGCWPPFPARAQEDRYVGRTPHPTLGLLPFSTVNHTVRA